MQNVKEDINAVAPVRPEVKLRVLSRLKTSSHVPFWVKTSINRLVSDTLVNSAERFIGP